MICPDVGTTAAERGNLEATSKTLIFYSFIASMASVTKVELWAKGHGKHDVPDRGVPKHRHFAGVAELIYMQKMHTSGGTRLVLHVPSTS